jgi:hypothetical protein
MSINDFIVPSSTEQARRWLKHLVADDGVSWQGLSDFLGVPVGTLWRFANGGKLPHKHKKKLGIYYDRKLHEMPTKELKWAIENRREI